METILVALAGATPQIITETLWAMHRESGQLPREVHVVTTRMGAARVREDLLAAQTGWFYRLCRDLGVDHRRTRFDDATIHVAGAERGTPLDDIRCAAHNEAVVETLWRVLDEATRDPAVAVHASLAGGRKTMTFLMGLGMSLFGRAHDRLSHVLVSKAFETHPGFYYIPSEPVALVTEAGRRLSTDEAAIELIDIPFVRLRGRVDPAAIRSVGYGGIAEVQSDLDRTPLELDMQVRTLAFGGERCRLSRANYAWYVYLLFQHLDGGRTHRPAKALVEDATLEAVAAAFPHPRGHDLGWIGDYLRNVLEGGCGDKTLLSAIGRINTAIRATWATRPEIAEWLSVRAVGERPARYGVNVPPDKVKVAVYPGV